MNHRPRHLGWAACGRALRGWSNAPRRSEQGLALTLVLIVFLFVELVVVGILSVVISDLHGAVAGQLALQSISVAEAGLNYGVARLVDRAAAPQRVDEAYRGEPDDVVLTATGRRALGTFHLTVTCVYPADALPPDCADDLTTTALDERDLRVIRSVGFVPGRPGRARRQIEATVRRYALMPGDLNAYGVCGRDGVELVESTVTADVGSNGDVLVDGPQRHPGTVVARQPRASSLAPLGESAVPSGTPGLTGVYTWRITFFDTSGRESGGSPPTPPLLLTKEHGRLTNIPTGNRSIVRRRVYRSAADMPRGPWFLVGEIPDNEVREYTDGQSDLTLRWPIPGLISGGIVAAGKVVCSQSCGSQVDGAVRANVPEVICPNFLAPPSAAGNEPATDPLIQDETHQAMHWGPLLVREDEGFTIQTLSAPDARLEVHVSDLILESGARLMITGGGTVYLHVHGTFVLERGAVLGAIDLSGNRLIPADRLHVFVHGRDPMFREDETASVRWTGDNKVAAVVFAPNANVLIDGAAAFRGGLFGRYVRLRRSRGIYLDPREGLGSAQVAVRPSAYQYVLRWYDHPRPAVRADFGAAGIPREGR